MSAKAKKTLYVAIFVSLASMIRVSMITDGFIVALSVLVMAIFIYCYEDLTPLYIAFCSGIFSPLLRLTMTWIQEGRFDRITILTLPDFAFFFTYGIFYTLIYKYIVREPKSMRNFPFVIFFCDFLSNVAEITCRSFINGSSLFTMKIIMYLIIIAFVRTLLVQMVVMAIEQYSNFLVNKEHDEEYKRLLTQASIFESELHVMEKNAVEIEDIMKQAYTLYKSMEEINAPEGLKTSSLNISRNAHEIKGDYLNIIGVLKDAYVNDLNESGMDISEIIALERSNVLSMIRKKGYNIDVSVRVKVNFRVVQSFKMMSIIRNLLTNAAEAIGTSGGRIVVSVINEQEKYLITVRDNGPGIDKDSQDTIFLAGYSTKFNNETGDIQRGLGLSLVKDYVENAFSGSIEVNSEVGKFTEITITLPEEIFGAAENEVLFS